MKRKYVTPRMIGERFLPNEYVAACGDENKIYKFTCDAGGGESGGVWLETNGRDGLQTTDGRGYKADTRISHSTSSFHACGIEHEASTTDDFFDGYYKASRWGAQAVNVKIWRGENGDNVHCTTNLDMSSWETAKS